MIEHDKALIAYSRYEGRGCTPWARPGRLVCGLVLQNPASTLATPRTAPASRPSATSFTPPASCSSLRYNLDVPYGDIQSTLQELLGPQRHRPLLQTPQRPEKIAQLVVADL